MTETITAAEYLAQNARLTRSKPHKYGAKRKEVDGITFDSTAEANRFCQLKLRERAGEITDLKLQPRFSLVCEDGSTGINVHVGDYIADFRYIELTGDAYRGGTACIVVEDVKGVATAVYRLKLRLFKAQYPNLVFREIKAPSRRRRRRKK